MIETTFFFFNSNTSCKHFIKGNQNRNQRRRISYIGRKKNLTQTTVLKNNRLHATVKKNKITYVDIVEDSNSPLKKPCY